MAQDTPRDRFRKLIPQRRELAKQMRLAAQRYRDLSDQRLDLNDSIDLIHDAIQDVMENPVPDLLEYAVLKAELHLTIDGLRENDQELQKILALQDKQGEALKELRTLMRELKYEVRAYYKVLPFRKAS